MKDIGDEVKFKETGDTATVVDVLDDQNYLIEITSGVSVDENRVIHRSEDTAIIGCSADEIE